MAGLTLVPTVFYVNSEEAGVLAPAVSGTTMQERIARLEKNPRRAAALAKARKRIGGWLADEQPEGTALIALRLAAGLSQRQLAERLGTQQSNVSRLERSPGNPSLSTLRNWSDALGVTIDRLVSAIEATSGGHV